MQILYWHLTPQTSTCSGSLSPPLLQRRDDGTSSSVGNNFLTSSSPGTCHKSQFSQHLTLVSSSSLPPRLIKKSRNTGDLNCQRSNQKSQAMEIENEDQTPTFYLLNAVDLPEDEDSSLNQNDQNDRPRPTNNNNNNNNNTNNNNRPLVAVGNGPNGDKGKDDEPPGGHYSSQSRKGSPSKRKKRRSNDLAKVLSFEDESDEESSINVGPSKSKKAKLIVNLYSEEQGYSFAYRVPGSNDLNESHSIPYSERYLLDSIDHEQIPQKVLCKLEDREGVSLMRYRNQVVAEIWDYRKSMPSHSNTGVPLTARNFNSNSAVMTNGPVPGNFGNLNKKPVVKQVMLRPTTESLLSDFDQIVEKALEERAGWCSLLRQTLHSTYGGDISHLLKGDEGQDWGSDCELELDVETSEKNYSNYLTYEQRLELEKEFVNQTAEPICLDPSPKVGLIANRIQFEKLKWNTEELIGATKRWQENPFKYRKILTSSSIPDASLNAPSLAEGRLDVEPFYNFVMTVKAKKELATRGLGHGILDKDKDKDALRLPPISYQDYPNLDPPKACDELLLRIGQVPDPAQLRIFPNENYVRKIEEYILETERRKRPHITKLSIFQRNGMESFFGELEMESFLDPTQPRFGTAPSSTKCQFELGSSRNVTLYVKQFSDIFTEDGRRPCKITYQKVGQPPQVVYTNSYKSATSAPPTTPAPPVPPAAPSQTPEAAAASAPTATSQIVTATITIPAPIVVSASAASTATVTVAAPISSTVTSTAPQIVQVATGSTVTIPGIVSVTQSLQRPPTPASIVVSAQAATTSSTTTTAPSLPPVQIVHPQPRTISQQQQQQQQQPQQPQKVQTTSQRPGQGGTIQIFSQQQNASQNATIPQAAQAAAQANVNLNVNLSSSGLTPQQVLTRPHIVNVNLQQQQQQQQSAAQQQLLQLTQQRILRMKQQQPNTALAKLLLTTNLQTKPITVAVQPTPQTPTSISNGSPVCSNPSPASAASCSTNTSANNATAASPVAAGGDPPTPQNPLGSPLMISSPPSVSSAPMTNSSQNVNVNVNASPNLSVNLNTISLDGLLNASSASYAGATTLTTNQAGGNLVAASNVNLGLSRITTNSGQPSVNILRLNNSTGTVATAAGGNTVQLAAVQRQLAMSNALNGNVSILQPGNQQGQQRILINANSMNNLTSGEIDELSVPDLTTLLGGQPIQISQLGQQQHILTNASTSAPSQTTIDTTNLNLNLNVNLNSGAVVNNGEGSVGVQQHQIAKIQGGEWTTTAQAPPFLVFISPLRQMPLGASAAAGTRQITATSAGTGTPQTLSLNLAGGSQSQIIQSQSTGKGQEGPTRILLGTCNNGVAIKREVATPVSKAATNTATTISGGGGGGESNSGQNININQNVKLEPEANLEVGSSSDVVVDGVDSLFNALSEAIGPEQLQKLEAIGGTMADSSAASSAQIQTSQIPLSSAQTMTSTSITTISLSTSSVATMSKATPGKSTGVITLSDLLGSPTVVSSSTGNAFPSLILSGVSSAGNSTSSSSPTLSSLLNSVTPGLGQGLSAAASSQPSASVTQSSIVSSTPRLSALLAGTPSADTVVVGANGPTGILGSSGSADSSTGAQNSASYGNLLDRLAASLNQPQNQGQNQVRTSTLHPIATATPSVVLDHPVLAATLTQQPAAGNPAGSGVSRGSSTFRQIAPAPSPAAAPASSAATSSSNSVAVISSSDIQSHTIQAPQLINLLGLVGNSSGGPGTGQTRTIRISASSPASNPSPGSASR